MDDPLHKTIREAKKIQADGNLSEAQTLYEQILDSRPHHAETNYLLGNLFLSRGEITKAAPFLVTSISHVFSQILESSQTLLHVLKRETVNLTKKKQTST